MYNVLARGGAFARSATRRSTGLMSRRNALELKGVDVSLASANVVTTTGTNANAILLNGITTGSGSFNRVGRKISMKTLRLKGAAIFNMTPSAVGVVPANSLRMVVVFDKQPNSGTIPTWDTIFGITDQLGAETSTVEAPLRYDNMSRFSVLKDKTFDVATVAGNVVSTGLIQQHVHFDEFFSLGNRETTYSGQSSPSTIADISTGALYVYFRANTFAAGANFVDIDTDSIARMRYLD